MQRETFNERVMFEKIEDTTNQSQWEGMSKSETIKIRILSWGTHRDGTPFENERYPKGTIAYIRKESMGINMGDGTFLIDRGHILLTEK